MSEAARGFGLKANGELWMWGQNDHGSIADGTWTTDRSSPVSIVGDHAFALLSSSGRTALDWSAAMKANGEIWTWGSGGQGRLGDNSTTSKSSPVSVVGAHAFTQFSLGYSTAYAIKANGEAWTWGEGGSGELGNNAITDRSSPVSVVGEHSFVFIAAGYNHALALKANGECWAWGAGTAGDLGDYTTANKSSPVSVVGEHAFTQVACGANHSVAIKANGECWSWGYNNNGQLGDGTRASKSSPVLVVGNHTFIQVACSTMSTYGLKANGELWAWGLNGSGELGDNTITSKSSPISVVGNHSFIQVRGGYYNVEALKANGEVWMWGLNDYGQLGDNSITNRSSPVLVVGSHIFAHILDFSDSESSSSSSNSSSSSSKSSSSSSSLSSSSSSSSKSSSSSSSISSSSSSSFSSSSSSSRSSSSSSSISSSSSSYSSSSSSSQSSSSSSSRSSSSSSSSRSSSSSSSSSIMSSSSSSRSSSSSSSSVSSSSSSSLSSSSSSSSSSYSSSSSSSRSSSSSSSYSSSSSSSRSSSSSSSRSSSSSSSMSSSSSSSNSSSSSSRSSSSSSSRSSSSSSCKSSSCSSSSRSSSSSSSKSSSSSCKSSSSSSSSSSSKSSSSSSKSSSSSCKSSSSSSKSSSSSSSSRSSSSSSSSCKSSSSSSVSSSSSSYNISAIPIIFHDGRKELILEKYLGSFNFPTSIGNYSITGLGFTPKLVIFFGNNAEYDGTSIGSSWMMGAATSSTNRYCATYSANTREYVVSSCLNTFCIEHPHDNLEVDSGDWTTVPDDNADFVSMDDDGFTINVLSIHPTKSTRVVNYLALGGDDFKVWLQPLEIPGTVDPKTVSYTGLGFKPDLLMLWQSMITNDINNHRHTGGSFQGQSLGFVHLNEWQGDAPHGRAIANCHSDDGYFRNTNTAASYQIAEGGSDWVKGTLVSTNDDGFVFNWSVVPYSGSNKAYVFCIALGGISSELNIRTSPVSDTKTSYASGYPVPFKPSVIFTYNTCSGFISGLQFQVYANFGMGVATETEQVHLWNGNTTQVAGSIGEFAYKDLDRTKLIKHLSMWPDYFAGWSGSPYGTPFYPPVLVNQAELYSINNNGYTLEWIDTTVANIRTYTVYLGNGLSDYPEGTNKPYIFESRTNNNPIIFSQRT